jgi:hypothetical protein
MASPSLPALLAFFFLVAAAAPDVGAFDVHVEGDGRFLLLDCSGGSGTASAKNSSSNVADLLAVIPSVAEPKGTAVLSRDDAFVYGVCILMLRVHAAPHPSKSRGLPSSSNSPSSPYGAALLLLLVLHTLFLLAPTM